MLVAGWTPVSVSGLFLRVNEIFAIEKDRLRKTFGKYVQASSHVNCKCVYYYFYIYL